MGRIPIRHLSPQQPQNLWPPKAFAGEVVPFAATVFKDGHDVLGVDLLLTDPSGIRTKHPMVPGAPGTDRWHTEALLDRDGAWEYRIQAYNDDWATWLHNARIKIPAGIDVALMLSMGADLLARAVAADPGSKVLKVAGTRITSKKLTAEERFAAADDPLVAAALDEQPLASLVTLSEPLTVRVERARAGLGSWYEFFPRSEGAKRKKDGSWTSGTFRTAARRIPAVAAMGFDVIYLPPIHPIGVAFRKGANNTMSPAPGDPGSPWAIGAKEGGHDAIHPDLGTITDFKFFLSTAKKNNIEVAIDLALQCSPDHPWVTEHPEWFTTLPDGTIAYAENPPKKYQDIYPINFDNDPVGLREEVLRIVKYWIGVGVKIFRVDNPHTKPLAFWEWLLHEINTEFPEIVFLAEAFTRPAMLHSLAQVGFQQSYTYFTWRNTKTELEEFFTSISKLHADFLRPNLFVNTPDILTEYLQFGGPAAFKIRAALAATAAPTWGVYAGYELFENVARTGSEENVDNEKYEYKQRDFAKAEALGRSLAPFLTRLNEIRAEHPALRQLRNLDLHWSDDDSILVYSKFIDGRFTADGRSDAILVIANVDPHSVRETTVHLDPTRFGIDPATPFEVTDLLTNQKFTWGLNNYVRLDAFTDPVHILRVEFPKGS
ncbi:alpha-1,4-glucan--maltose-1-phosphate maltosyltransferase [Marisediminicola antarctica]|uniref:Alpha-1,4-glucan:maltose-1-phosphate maltosyltransferase n=2 Tax=Marisediminicola antarctica TaxID=674079 RepID=A0A7L5AMB3_9MICO|nr:alpha-1,4-glucan--maltose-1-phosphate maltosyltransferase [Marisediminicola antarctica]